MTAPQAALSLRESYMLKAPNSKLSGKDKAAIVAKVTVTMTVLILSQ